MPGQACRDFNPLPPCGGRLYKGVICMSEISISIHSLRVEGDIKLYLSVLRESISIHSLRVEGDQCCAVAISKRAISIHSLRVEGDKDGLNCISTQPYFNPLPPCGGRLYHAGDVRRDRQFQSTPSVWRETTHGSGCQRPCAISIHSLRVEGDLKSLSVCRIAAHFNPLPPCGGRRINIICIRHAEHNFNPLPPCGGRRGLSTTTASP